MPRSSKILLLCKTPQKERKHIPTVLNSSRLMPARVPTLNQYIHRRPDPDSRQAHRHSATERRLLSCPVIPPPSSSPSNQRSEQTRTGWMTEMNRTRNAWRAADCGRSDRPPWNGGGPSEKRRPAPQNRSWRTADESTATTADFSADWP
jgi:hypothetical protein